MGHEDNYIYEYSAVQNYLDFVNKYNVMYSICMYEYYKKPYTFGHPY